MGTVSKVVKTFSLDEDVAEMLDNDENLNNSAVANSLFREYLVSGQTADVALKMRLRDLERDLENKKVEKQRIESQIENIQREIRDVEQQIQERRQQGVAEIEEFVETVRNDEFHGDLDPDNPAIQNYARKAQMSPERFIEEVKSRL